MTFSKKIIAFLFTGNILLVILIANPLIGSAIGDQVQSLPTPTPSGIAVIQGGDNMGRVQLLTMPEILNRTGIRAWRDAGWTGRGQRIGVLDLGFGGLLSFEARNAKTVTIMPGADKNSYDADTNTYGTNVLEIIAAIAPEADLYSCQYSTFDQFVECIDWMLVSGVKIINHSVGVPALPLDGTNEWAREVDRAARAGILWVNAAGNFAHGYLSEFFSDTNINTYHEFRGVGINETLAVEVHNQQSGLVLLSWEGNDTTPANAIDFDLEIIDADDRVIVTSTNRQNGDPGDTALELVLVSMNRPFGIRVRNIDGMGEGVRLVLFAEFVSLPGAFAQGSIVAPGDSLNALTVGGQQGNVAAPYSSQGPLSTGAIKPDLIAPAEIQLNDGSAFVGTSAATPVVTGVAALVWEAHPEFTNTQLFSYLRSMTVDDSELPGPDSKNGMGRLYLAPPATDFVLDLTATATLGSPIPANTPIPTLMVDSGTPAEDSDGYIGEVLLGIGAWVGMTTLLVGAIYVRKKAFKKPYIVINYRREDSRGYPGRIADRLKAVFGQNQVFFDVDSIPGGASFWIKIQDAIANSDVLIAVIGPDWLTILKKRIDQKEEDFVRREILEAFEQNIPVIPVFINVTKPPSKDDLPPDLQKLPTLNAIFIRDDSFIDDMNRLVRQLRKIGIRSRPVSR
jgi:subtilisin family serine protease